jgi:hypothetical protein
MADKRLSWTDWQKKANAEYVKGQYGAAQMIRDWGYPKEFGPEQFKIEFDKGSVKRKDRSARQQHRGKADELRTKRDVTTTETAEAQRKALKAEIAKEAQSTLVQYGTGGAKPIFEHNVQLSDPYWQTTDKPPGDPDNLSKSDPFFEAQKTEFEKYNTQAGRPFVPTVNEITGELRVIPRQYFDSLADPSTLPGMDIALDAEPKSAFTEAVKRLPGLTSKAPGTIEFNAGLGTQAYKSLMQNKRMSALGVGLDVLTDKTTQEAVLKGDVKTAGTRLATSAAVGSVVGSALKAAPAVARVATPAAAVATGAALFEQGKPGSFVEKAVNKAATVVPGLKANPKTDIGRRALNELQYIGGSIRFGKLPYTR